VLTLARGPVPDRGRRPGAGFRSRLTRAARGRTETRHRPRSRGARAQAAARAHD
jgi:hypothetical protein